jgi:hypothetical protein
MATMTVLILHDDEDATIEVHPAQRLVRLTWKQPCNGEAYRSMLLRLLDVVRETGARLWLSDGRRSGRIMPEDQAWTMAEYTPKVLQAGLVRIAIVNREDLSDRNVIEQMVDATPKEAPYDIAFFQDPAIAQLWLMDPKRNATNVYLSAGGQTGS